MTRWTAEQVHKLAPDASSLAAARKLAVPQPWSETGATDALVWGKCQGSGKTPYQVSVDLTGPAFRCSCPSRKFPCKHALALLLLWVQGGGTIADSASAAEFAEEWAAGRAARSAAREAGEAGTTAARPADPEARAKRLAERMALMDAGVADLRTWLTDLVRTGLAGARQQPYSWWDGTAARLVDAQLPGLAQYVRDLGSAVHRRDDWPDHLLRSAGVLWAASHAWLRRDQLSEAELGDLRAFVGWPYATEEIRRGETVTDRWHVLGAWRTDLGRLQEQRTWLWGERSGSTVVLLDFAAGGQVLPVAKVTGAVLAGTVALYPGTAVRRALLLDEPEAVGRSEALPAGADLAGTLAGAAATWAENPWAAQVPVQLRSVELADGQVARDPSGRQLPLTAEASPWWLLAVTGGRPVDVFAELVQGRLRLLSLVVDEEYLACA